MKFSGSRVFATVCVLLALAGCASQSTVVSQQTITRAMLTAPPEPKPPNPDTATQREVAIYIVRLRSVIRQMTIQMQKAAEQLPPDDK